jgi:hypothetical protein
MVLYKMSNTKSSIGEFLTGIESLGIGMIVFSVIYFLAIHIPVFVPEWIPIVVGVVASSRYLTRHR